MTSTRAGIGTRAIAAVGGLALLMLGTVGTSAATEAPGEAPDGTAPEGNVDAAVDGVYEPCTEDFGREKGTIVELSVLVDGVIPAPPLTYPDDVQVVVEYDPGSGLVTCEPVLVTPENWAMTFWGDLGLPQPSGNAVYLPEEEEEGDPCDLDFTLKLVGSPPGLTVVTGEVAVTPFTGAFCEEESFEDFLLGFMTQGQFDALDALLVAETGDFPVEGCNEDGTGTPSEDLQGALDAIVEQLDPQFLDLWNEFLSEETPLPCAQEKFFVAVELLLFQLIYEDATDNEAVFALATPPAPVVITPTFTG